MYFAKGYHVRKWQTTCRFWHTLGGLGRIIKSVGSNFTCLELTIFMKSVKQNTLIFDDVWFNLFFKAVVGHFTKNKQTGREIGSRELFCSERLVSSRERSGSMAAKKSGVDKRHWWSWLSRACYATRKVSAFGLWEDAVGPWWKKVWSRCTCACDWLISW